jgi:hypothetical protein
MKSERVTQRSFTTCLARSPPAVTRMPSLTERRWRSAARAVVVAAFTGVGVLWQEWVLPGAGDHDRTRVAAAVVTLAALAAYAHASRDPVRR